MRQKNTQKKMLTDQVFNLHKATRENLLTFLENKTPEQLAIVPQGFNNNIWWNIAHCVAQGQLLCYKMAQLEPVVAQDFIEKYKKGTYPDGNIPTLEDIQALRELLLRTQKQLQNDYQRGVFENFQPYLTSYGYELKSIEDAINFNNAHEAMHLGTIKALNYFVK